MNAAELYAEHRGDLESAKRAGYFAGGGVSDLGGGHPSSALLYRDVVDAFADLEHALEHHEPVAASVAAWNWWTALDRLMGR